MNGMREPGRSSSAIRRLALFMAAVLLMPSAQAQVYRSVDANGKTVFSDKPPPDSVRPATPANAGKLPAGAASAAPESGKNVNWQDKEREFRVRQIDKNASEQRERQEREKRCEQARRREASLSNSDGIMLYRTDPGGARSFIDDNERSRLAQDARQAVEINCRR